MQYLYPSERQVLAAQRRSAALCTYLYLRQGELDALTWDDVDLEDHIVRTLLAERAGFESDHVDREEPPTEANVAEPEGAVEPFEDAPQSPQPKAAGNDAATVAAVKAALDEGRFERAAALLDVLRRTSGAGQVITLEGRRDRTTT